MASASPLLSLCLPGRPKPQRVLPSPLLRPSLSENIRRLLSFLFLSLSLSLSSSFSEKVLSHIDHHMRFHNEKVRTRKYLVEPMTSSSFALKYFSSFCSSVPSSPSLSSFSLFFSRLLFPSPVPLEPSPLLFVIITSASMSTRRP